MKSIDNVWHQVKHWINCILDGFPGKVLLPFAFYLEYFKGETFSKRHRILIGVIWRKPQIGWIKLWMAHAEGI